MKTSLEAKLFLSLLKKYTCATVEEKFDLAIDSRIDWHKLKTFAELHNLESFIYHQIKECGFSMPEEIYSYFREAYLRGLQSSQYFLNKFLEISGKFEEKGLTLVPIKGMAFLLDIYSAIPLRLMTDIDILIKEEELKEAKEILWDLNYTERLDGLKEEYWLEKQCHLAFFKKGTKNISYVDMHFGLDFKRKNRLMLPELWNRLRERNLNGRNVKLLSPEDDFFSLALHLRRYGNVLGLKNAFDLAMILKKYGNEFNWDYVLSESKKGKMCSAAFFMLSQADVFFGCNIPKIVWKTLNMPSYKKFLVRKILDNTFSLNFAQDSKEIYLKSHFLLYDNLWEPIDYILNIPQEQFAKFYNLKAYDKKTDSYYQNRIFYILFKTLSGLIHPKSNHSNNCNNS